MSINKLNISEDLNLSKALEKQGSTFFYFNFIKGRDAFIGPSESVQFIENFIKKYENTQVEFHKI